MKKIKLTGILFLLLFFHQAMEAQEIFEAIKNGNSEQFSQLLNANDSIIHSRDQYENTPLHMAVYFNQLEFQHKLLEHGADIQAVNQSGRNALVFAIAKNNIKSASLLLQKGIDLNAKDHNGREPLHWCAELGDKEMAEVLIQSGAAINSIDDQIKTPLHFAASSDNTEVAEVLIQNGALVNVVDYHASTPLFTASWNGHLEMIKLLIDHGAVVDARYIGAASPLTTASVADHTQVCKYLVSKGADVNLVCNMQVTPLYPAVVNNNLELTQFFIHHEAKLNYKDIVGRTPLYVAVRDGYYDIVKLLIKHGADTRILDESTGRTLLHIAASNGREDIFKLLHREGVYINSKDKFGFTALDYANKHGFNTLAGTIRSHGGKAGASLKPLDVKEISRNIKDSEAYLVKLRNNTWSINTKAGMFVLGYEQCGNVPEEASLVNGTLIGDELKEVPVYHFDGAFSKDVALFHKQEEFDHLSFICNLNYKNRYERQDYYDEESTYFPKDFEPVQVNDAMVTALPGFKPYHKSYLIQTNGLNIVWLYWQSDRYNPSEKNTAPIDYLKSNDISVDLLFIGVSYSDMGPEWISVMEEEYEMAKELDVQAIFPVPSCKMGEQLYNERKRKGDGEEIWYATNPGETFYYKDGKVLKL